ncbi:MAG: glutamine amidotransferase [Achromobacter sp.]|uniref:glutamine amidotransferase n=1 Tax=Achromobacter sp. TaxID=134375 RepID=UPI0025834608|nr:glutamine amidotransferase [Achromobacter sp.]MCW0209458.1 glutamine amidotransferase [Achromobacter sp.]
MSRLALAVRHVPFEDLGILAPALAERGYTVQYLDAGVDAIDAAALADADLAVILGGPVGVYETDRYPFLKAELRAIGERLRRDRPTLGICLGAQLMAAALGAEVAPAGRAEIGYAPLTLTADGQASPLRAVQSVPVLHWHGDQFGIPAGARRLAETPGFPNQAFSLGPRILGLQFHLEADASRIEQWLIGHACELSRHGIDPAAIRRDAERHGPSLARSAGLAIGIWLDAL